MITLLTSILIWAGVTITLQPEAKVAGTELTLGALATVQCDDPQLAARINAMALGYAPAPGFSRVLDAAAIVRQVRALAPGQAVTFLGAQTCRVQPLTEFISAESISAAARGALEQHLKAKNLEDCTFELSGELAAIEVPRGKLPCTLEVAPQAAKQGQGPALIAVRLNVDGQTYRTAYTSWKVLAWRDQPVLLRDVRAGELIDASMVELRRAPIDAGLAASALEGLQVYGTAAARDLQSGKTLLSGDLVRPTIVRKGDALMLVIESGAVKVRTPVTAEQAGALGDRIKVVVQQTGRELNAIVESRDSVRLSLGAHKQSGEKQQ